MWVIGDVHGCHTTLMALIDRLPSDAQLCFVGDLIDRGPDSAKVVEFVKSGGHHCVLGNHEQMMLDHQPQLGYGDTPIWFRNGGYETLASYNGDTDLLDSHKEWMLELPLYLEFSELTRDGRYLLVSHSSFAQYYADSLGGRRDIDDIIWNRHVASRTLKSSNPFFNIFGHTVSKNPIVKHYFASIDTGAVYTNHKGYGTLTAIHFPSLEIIQQPNIEETL